MESWRLRPSFPRVLRICHTVELRSCMIVKFLFWQVQRESEIHYVQRRPVCFSKECPQETLTWLPVTVTVYRKPPVFASLLRPVSICLLQLVVSNDTFGFAVTLFTLFLYFIKRLSEHNMMCVVCFTATFFKNLIVIN